MKFLQNLIFKNDFWVQRWLQMEGVEFLLILIWLTVVNRRHLSRPLRFCGLVLI
jgi:hypothetical protein